MRSTLFETRFHLVLVDIKCSTEMANLHGLEGFDGLKPLCFLMAKSHQQSLQPRLI